MIAWRLNFFRFLILLFFACLIFKFFKIQVLAHAEYSSIATKQHWVGREIPAERGKILMSDGFTLAIDINTYLLYSIPPKVNDSKATAEKLIDVIGFETKAETEEDRKQDKEKATRQLEDKLNQKKLQWIALARKLDAMEKAKIESLSLEGIGFEKEFTRFYPEGKTASHVLGFVGSDEQGNKVGYYGIEGYFDGILKGLSGVLSEEQDPVGRPIPVGDYIPLLAENGQDVVLTLNHELQYLIEKKLKEGVERYDAKSGSVIILDPASGEILAMANYPDYSPQDWEKWANDDFAEGEIKDKYRIGKDVFQNSAIAKVYEPGSVFKPFTMSAGIETGKITPETTFESKPIEIQGYVIRTWNDKYFGEESMSEVLQHSDNTGAAWLALQLGVDTVYDYFKKYHLGEKIDIKLEDEEEGLVKPKDEWMPIDLATAAFGQGISVTPLQLISAYQVIANNGIYNRPQIVKEIRGEDKTTTYKSPPPERIISEETAKTLVDMLTSVVEKGEFKFAVLPGYKIAGKTGTAQIPRNGTYDPNKTDCTFVGFAPASEPKFLMLVKLEEPTASTYSAETAVPLWMNIVKELFVYYGVPPNN